ncbi:MAG: DUF6179 domain-containing protein [Eubacteriales bacterium]|nr:DUF6179 domain-containing protein [Eubacteriales bacterium]
MESFELAFAGLTEQEQAAAQRGLWRLLEKQAAAYTQGDSASLPVETAQALMESIIYMLRVYLRTEALPDRALADPGAEALFAPAQKRLEQLRAQALRLYEEARMGALGLDNQSYRDTLKGIGTFFRLYDWRTMAHETPGDIDYQLCLPVPEAETGVCFLLEYLRRLLIENDFLARFDPALERRLLNRSCPDYRGLLVNLYEPIACNALGLALLGAPCRTLNVSPQDRARMSTIDAAALQRAAAGASDQLGLSDPAARYLAETARALAPRVREAEGLSHLFLSF